MTKKPSVLTTDSGLLALRVGIGAIFIFSGAMKIVNLQMTVGLFASMGFGTLWAYLVSVIELVGGIALFLGAYTRVFSFLLMIIMLVAIYAVHSDMSLAMTPIAVFFSTLCLTLSGGGKYALLKK